MKNQENETAQTLDLDPYIGVSRDTVQFVVTESPVTLPTLTETHEDLRSQSPVPKPVLTETHEDLRSQSSGSFQEVDEEFIRVETPPSPASVGTEFFEDSRPPSSTERENSVSDSDAFLSTRSHSLLEHHALVGDWKAAKNVLDSDESVAIDDVIAPYSMTALHVASLKGHSGFVKKIVQEMPREALKKRDEYDLTALDYIAFNGNLLEAAKALIGRNDGLPDLLSDDGRGALHFAVLSESHSTKTRDFVRYLAQKTTNERVLSDDLVENLVVKGYLDVLLDLLDRFPSYLENTSNVVALFDYLSSTPSNFSSSSRFGPVQRFIYSFIPVESSYKPTSNTEEQQRGWHILKALLHAYYQALHWLQLLLYNIFRRAIPSSCIIRHQDAKRRHNCAVKLVNKVWNLILERDAIRACFARQPVLHRALQLGILEISRMCFQRRPQLFWFRLRHGKSFLRDAILNRRDKIFNFLMEDKTCFLREFYELAFEENILHEVAELAPLRELSSVPGAALQMQREMQWFKAVEKLMPPNLLNKKDEKKLTAWELFTKKHEELAKAGETWMKDTSNSCMIVSTLITTVVFSAAFTLPGGNNESNGIPIFLQSKAFLVFAFSDALALFSSLTSLLMFLAILTSRYAVEDFLKSLPKRLIIGLASLFFAIATMIIAFGAALFIVLSERIDWVLIPIISLVSFPVSLFILLQLPLFIQMVESTYWSNLNF